VMDRWGKADPRHGSAADSLAELISPVMRAKLST
jgi:hypothetical protein